MLSTRYGFAGAVLIAGTLAVSATVYPHLPPVIPIHWDARGVPNGFAPKAVGAFLMPMVMLAMYGFLLAMPSVCPKVLELQQGREAFDTVALSTTAFMAGVHGLILMAGLGHPVSMACVLPVMLGGLFLALAGPMAAFPRNPWFGVRTPWTLASDTVWRRTHQLCATLFRFAGLGAILAGLLGLGLYVTLIMLLGAALIPVVYSWAIFPSNAD